MQPTLSWLAARPIAHRGLHDDRLPENSIAAARAAADHGFAVECDVHLSSDRVPMVFHDDTLDRLTEMSGPLGDRPSSELVKLALAGTGERIPTVADFLRAINGKVPVVMELKGTSPDADADFLQRLGPLLDDYDGDLALMSFDHWLIDQALAYGKRPVGLTAEGTEAEALARHREIFDQGCGFVSYCVDHLPNEFTDYVRDRAAPLITWTVRNPAQVTITKTHADQMTFEGFLPQN